MKKIIFITAIIINSVALGIGAYAVIEKKQLINTVDSSTINSSSQDTDEKELSSNEKTEQALEKARKWADSGYTEQTVTVYSSDGRKIRSWSGKLKVNKYTDRINIDDKDNGMTDIYGGVVITEIN